MVGTTITEQKKKEMFVFWLRFIACLLITNSHCRNIYPFYFLAIGGGHGNAIFFILSGYCLAEIHQPFGEWIWRRIKRIIPALLVVMLISVFFVGGTGELREMDASAAILFYLNKYWFVFAIIVFYPLYYCLFCAKRKQIVQAAIGLYMIIYVVLYVFFIDKTKFCIELEGFSPFKVYFYFGVLLVGGLLRLEAPCIHAFSAKQKRTVLGVIAVVILGSIVLWGSIYFAIMVRHSAYNLQFLIHVSIYVFSISVLLLSMMYTETIVIPNNVWGHAATIIANSTLEVYLVQVTFVKCVETFPFPLNLALFWGIAILGGITLHSLLEHFLWKRQR